MFFVEAGIRLFGTGEVSEGLHRGRCECGLGQPTRRAGSEAGGGGMRGRRPSGRRAGKGEGRRGGSKGVLANWRGSSLNIFCTETRALV